MASLIYPFDPNWSLSLMPSLSNICLHWIVNNFEENPIFEKLSPIQKDFVQERLSTSLPLHVTASLVPDGVYWKRCCKERWNICDVSHYGDSWKRMFFERHLENIIEGFIPEVTEPKTVLDLVPLCRNYIKKLDISQLLLPTKEPGLKKVEEKSDWSLNIDVDEPHVDHFDFSILLDKLTNLEELHLVYRVKQCGMDFEWAMFQMSDKDCKSLACALKSCKSLKLFRLHQSHVDDGKCRLLVKYLLDHPSLRELDFSHNLIGDSAARAIGKLLTRSKLEVLNMCNNIISCPGAKAIAHALSSNSTLLVLNLHFNRVMDEGGQAIGKALLKNTTLSYLHLGSNDMTSVTAFALSKVLTENKTLKRINLSCNKLGVVGGKALAEAMSQNSTITECKIHISDIDEEAASTINKVVLANQSSEQDKLNRGK